MKNKTFYSKYKLFSIFILIAVIFMGIGYASVNSIALNIDGEVTAMMYDSVFITDIKCVNCDEADDENIVINLVNQTLVNSSVYLDSLNGDSNIKLEITIYNPSDKDYVFAGSFYDDNFYDNKNIVYELENIAIDDIVRSGATKTFYVNFRYNDGDTTNNLLNSVINYRFELEGYKETLSGIEFNYLLKNSDYAPEGDVYEYYSKDANRAIDNTIKIIVFGKKDDYIDEVSDLTPKPIDMFQTGSICMYRKTLSDGMYKIYILSESGNFILNENAAWMFDKLYSLEEIINLHLLDTSKVTNMRDMFCDCASLKRIDLSNFDTSNVTNMIGMFARMTLIEYLDLSSFDISNVIELGQMFSADTNLKRIYVSDKWVLNPQIEEEDGSGLFSNCTNLVGGNGTVYNVSKLTYTMAVVDGEKEGYLTNGYNLNTGINVNHVIKNKSADEIEDWTLEKRFVDTSVTSLTFGQMRDYNSIVSGYDGSPVDSDGSGVISAFHIPNGKTIDVYILSNSGLFEANVDSSWLFDNLVKLEIINNLPLLDTSKVTNMRDMFCDTQTIRSLDLSGFDTSNATSFEGMFARMYNIEVLDISSFNTSKITTIKNMFVHAISTTETYVDYLNVIPKLKTIYVSNKWNISNLTSETVFGYNLSLVGGNGTIFDSSKTSSLYARVDTNSAIGYFTLK